MRFALSAILLAYLFQKIDWIKTKEVLQNAHLSYIFYAVLIFFFINAVVLYRWYLYIEGLSLTVNLLNVVRYFFIGLFGNLFLPSAIGGDVIKIFGLCKNSTEKPKVVASVLLDRLSGFTGIVLLAIVAFFYAYPILKDGTLLGLILVLALICGCMGSILFYEPLYIFACRIFNRLPKVKKSLMTMHYDIILLKDRKDVLYKTVLLSSLAQCLLAVTFYLLARALDQGIAFIYFLTFIPLICVASSFPSIGGLGVREAGAAYLFAKVGMPAGIAVSISLMNFLFMVLVGLIGGIFFMVTLNPAQLREVELNTNLKDS